LQEEEEEEKEISLYLMATFWFNFCERFTVIPIEIIFDVRFNYFPYLRKKEKRMAKVI